MYVLPPAYTDFAIIYLYVNTLPFFVVFHSKEDMFSLFLYKLIVSFTRTNPTITSSTNEPTLLRTSLISTGAQQIAGK